MGGLKTIRTSNWNPMVTFYRSLGMRELSVDHDDLRSFKDFGVELELEFVPTADQHEVRGKLEMFSEDLPGLSEYWSRKGFKFNRSYHNLESRLEFCDPDGNVVSVAQQQIETANQPNEENRSSIEVSH